MCRMYVQVCNFNNLKYILEDLNFKIACQNENTLINEPLENIDYRKER